MVNRCKYRSHTSWKWYGAKGIKVCKRWLLFENFLLDMGLPPSPKHSIERRQNKGNYEPENCYWATEKEQQINKSTTLLLTFQGKTQPAIKWAEELGINYDLISNRKCHGWSDERTLSEPKNIPLLLTFNGKTQSRFEWASEIGIKSGTIWWRLKHGWPIERILSTQLHQFVKKD